MLTSKLTSLQHEYEVQNKLTTSLALRVRKLKDIVDHPYSEVIYQVLDNNLDLTKLCLGFFSEAVCAKCGHLYIKHCVRCYSANPCAFGLRIEYSLCGPLTYHSNKTSVSTWRRYAFSHIDDALFFKAWDRYLYISRRFKEPIIPPSEEEFMMINEVTTSLLVIPKNTTIGIDFDRSGPF